MVYKNKYIEVLNVYVYVYVNIIIITKTNLTKLKYLNKSRK